LAIFFWRPVAARRCAEVFKFWFVLGLVSEAESWRSFSVDLRGEALEEDSQVLQAESLGRFYCRRGAIE